MPIRPRVTQAVLAFSCATMPIAACTIPADSAEPTFEEAGQAGTGPEQAPFKQPLRELSSDLAQVLIAGVQAKRGELQLATDTHELVGIQGRVTKLLTLLLENAGYPAPSILSAWRAGSASDRSDPLQAADMLALLLVEIGAQPRAPTASQTVDALKQRFAATHSTAGMPSWPALEDVLRKSTGLAQLWQVLKALNIAPIPPRHQFHTAMSDARHALEQKAINILSSSSALSIIFRRADPLADRLRELAVIDARDRPNVSGKRRATPSWGWASDARRELATLHALASDRAGPPASEFTQRIANIYFLPATKRWELMEQLDTLHRRQWPSQIAQLSALVEQRSQFFLDLFRSTP